MKAAESDPSLTKILAAWPMLSEPIRRVMLALICRCKRGCTGRGSGLVNHAIRVLATDRVQFLSAVLDG
jgi:hypothetical protein